VVVTARVSPHSREPKVALVVGALNRGGVERQIVEFVQAAHPGHADCLVICLTDAGCLADDVSATGARVVPLGFRRSPTAASAFVRLMRLLRKERPDAICAFLFWSYVIVLPAAAAVTPRTARIAGRASLPEFDVPPQRWLVHLRRLADGLADAVIVNCEAVRLAWEEVTPSLRHKLHVVPYGARPRPRLPERDAQASLTLVCVANLIGYKGHATLLRALAELKQLEWRLLLAGDGPERLAIEKLARDYSISSRVEFLGVVSDVSAVFHQADLAVLASDTEGLPNAVLEAMAHGVPVVATAVGGVPELLGSSGAGTVVPVRDPSALGEAIRTYLEDPALRQRAGEIGRREVEEKYSVEAMRDRTLAAFDAFRTAAG
jgi:glycosyltransferase involved in cell wall biosynthesis